MTYKFLIKSDDSLDFRCEILIDSEASFGDFKDIILSSLKYKSGDMCSFYICDDDWERGTEITAMDMNAGDEYDTWLMSETKLCELLEDKGDKAEFVFDYMTDRFFYIELKEVNSSQKCESPKCTLLKGNPPKQEVDFDDYITKNTSSLDLDNNFYGDSQYNEDEIDEEGFDIKDPNDPSFDERESY